MLSYCKKPTRKRKERMETKKLLRVLLFVTAFLIASRSFSQTRGESELHFMLKLLIYQETVTKGVFLGNQTFNTVMSVDFTFDTLKSIGISSYDFISISSNYSIPNSVSKDKLPLIPNNCDEYVVAVSKGLGIIFRLKGFKINDFSSFIAYLREDDEEARKSMKRFLKDCEVEGLDLICLFKASRGISLDIDKFPCMKSCSDLFSTH